MHSRVCACRALPRFLVKITAKRLDTLALGKMCMGPQSLCAYYPHLPRGKVWIYRLLFVSVCVCTVTNFSGGDKASGVKFCKVVYRRLGQVFSHFGELCSPRSRKSDESASVHRHLTIHVNVNVNVNVNRGFI